jgi:hypothetical protein
VNDQAQWSPLHFDANDPLTLCRSWVDPIRESLVWVHLHRQLWQEVMKDFDLDPKPVSSVWRGHYIRLYVDSQVAAVRRMAEGTNKDEISLARLLTTIRRNVASFDLDRLCAAATQSDLPGTAERRRGWLEVTWGDGSGHLSVGTINADFDRLHRDTAVVRTWASKAIAHIDQKGAKAPTFGELDASINDVTEIFQRYGSLLTGTHYEMNVAVDPGWRVPLGKLFQNWQRRP